MDILDRLSQMDKAEAIALLKGSYRDFCSAIESALHQTRRNAIVPDDGSAEQTHVCRKANELRDLGYARLTAAIAKPECLTEPRAFAKALPARAALLGVQGKNVFDAQMQGLFWARHISKFNTRISFNSQSIPQILEPLLDGAAVAEKIINKAIGIPGVEIRKNLLIVDNLQPMDSFDFQWWHFDRLYEQYKVMILLDDVDTGSGPMRLLPCTHKFEGSRRIYDFCNYAEPEHGADPGYNVIKDRLADIVSLEGTAGDAFVFDTKVFHAHGRPTIKERNTATIYYQPPPTPLNVFYRTYQPAGQFINY